MKKVFVIATVLIAAVLFSSCDQVTNPVDENTGKLFVNSIPDSAKIFVNGTFSGKFTPDTIKTEAGMVDIKLTKEGYKDTTVSISVSANQVGVLNVVLTPLMAELFIDSDPAGAQIWLNGVNSGFVTPHDFTSIEPGTYNVTLKLENYQDTTFTINVPPGDATSMTTIVLAPVYLVYGPVKIYETVGTTADQPSGLDLSTGNAYGISGSDKDKVDIYYSSDGFLVRSASYHSNMTRETYFKVGNASDLFDGVDSPVKDNTWEMKMSDRESHYVFLYDEDGNYSKLKIVNYGGGTPGEPAWLEVKWIYNKATGNTKF